MVKREERLLGLFARARAGDAGAYHTFLAELAGHLRAFFRRRLARRPDDVEDLVQETLLAVHNQRHTYVAGEPLTPWLYAIARYKLVDAFRRRGRRMEIEIGEVAETFAAPQSETISKHEIGRALETLSPGQRSVVAAVSIEGRSVSETAKILGMKETAVRVALHRGLTSLATRFARN